MLNARSLLGRAFALSLILHAAVMVIIADLVTPAGRFWRLAPAEVTVRLRGQITATEVPAPPQLPPPRDPPRNANPAAPRQGATLAVPRAASAPWLAGEAALRAAEQLQRELPYPPEAIERGLQGEALVLLFLDPSGHAIAARLEASSGHALLDDAAVRAARSLRSLPDSAPREALLPVRFRLR
jgi:protein TonB